MEAILHDDVPGKRLKIEKEIGVWRPLRQGLTIETKVPELK